jgi:hypothetical protein
LHFSFQKRLERERLDFALLFASQKVPFPSGATIVAQGKFKLIAVLFIAGKIKKKKQQVCRVVSRAKQR